MATQPRTSSPPECGYVWRTSRCAKNGQHYCEPRATKFVDFCRDVLVHTKGDFARQAFILDPWQEWDIARPVFGTVRWDSKLGRYVRQYRIAWIEIARKNGKTELAAAVVIFLLVADDEESAEIYGAAKTTKQAGKVAEVVERMRQLIPSLNADKVTKGKRGRLKYNKNNRRQYDQRSGSYYEVCATDDPNAELGNNPHGVVIDEFLAQASADFYNSQRTAMGTRSQPLMFLLTTAGNNPSSFGALQHAEFAKVLEDPSRSEHIFVYIRSLPKNDEELERLRLFHPDHPDLPVSCDPFDERNWAWPNPALDSFLNIDALRQEALEAKNDPTKENSFRQFRANQWVSQVTRWINLDVWDESAGMVVEERLLGRRCYAGLDVSSTTDLTAWVLLFPPENDDECYEVLWRAWTPEAKLADLDSHLGGKATVWARQGLLYATEGDWIDYAGDPVSGMSTSTIVGRSFPSLHKQIDRDSQHFAIQCVGYDVREATATAQFMAGLGLTIKPVRQGYMLSESLKEIQRLTKAKRLTHGGNPVARWHIDSAEVKTDDNEHIKLVKPDRNTAGARVDLVAGLADAMAVMLNPPDSDEKPNRAAEWANSVAWTCPCGRINSRSIDICAGCGNAQAS